MKIFIIGPEGSGKTVMLAMLSRYVTTERKDLALEPIDFETSRYVVEAQAELAKGDWPPSTLQGVLRTLQWRFGLRGAPLHKLHEIVMFDAAGQDIRKILLQDDLANLTDKQRELRAQIDAAQVLVYLLDLNGFFASRDPAVINENAWLFKTFLTRQNWREKRRLVVLSKADIFRAMLVSLDNKTNEEAKVREIVKRHLPTYYTLDHLVDLEKSVSYFAVASVVTTTVIDLNGNPVRIPAGLKQSGLPEFVEALHKAIDPPTDEAENVAFWAGALFGLWVGISYGFKYYGIFGAVAGALVGAVVCGGIGVGVLAFIRRVNK